MPKKIEDLLKEYRREIENISDNHIKKIILYGSYARGDYSQDSDIDIMVLMDLEEPQIKAYENKIYDATYYFNDVNETEIMPVVQNIYHFNYWKKAYMFYRNVEEEGVII